MMRWVHRTIVGFAAAVIGLTALIWVGTGFWGGAFGVRHAGPSRHYVLGVYPDNDGDAEGETWYYIGVLPLAGNQEWNLCSHPPGMLLGFNVMRYHATPTDRYWAFGVPFWFVDLIAGYVGVRSLRRLRRLRRAPGWCRGCGYDLRATPARCPECGLVVTGARTEGVGGVHA